MLEYSVRPVRQVQKLEIDSYSPDVRSAMSTSYYTDHLDAEKYKVEGFFEDVPPNLILCFEDAHRIDITVQLQYQTILKHFKLQISPISRINLNAGDHCRTRMLNIESFSLN
ncbi:hypothetical protein HZH68_011408 [Vespula germanica]|uniref:Uncharacterized protein n=1 Tax=Vespula germanica TaxID=30212 RepID=A0A834N113_VESGE|nr:hypothetical protein HZH68_011408 [Vespula germanica]